MGTIKRKKRKWLGRFALGAIVFAAGCSGFGESDDESAVASYRYALVACADWAGQNSLAAIQLKPAVSPRPWMDYLADLGADVWLDPVVRTHDLSGRHRALVIQREYGSALGMGTIAVLDPANRFQVAARYPVNDGLAWSNPNDILVLSADKAYVTRWDPAYNDILILNPDTGDPLGHIDFSGLGSTADGLPRLFKMFYLQGRVWVLMQNINAFFTEYGTGAIGVVNPETDALEDIIALDLRNPADLGYDAEANRLYVASSGDRVDLGGSGIELVNPATRTSVGVLLDGNDLGGFATHLVMTDPARACLVVEKPGWGTGDKVVRVNLAQGTMGDTLYEYPGLYVPDLALDERQTLLIADNPGSRVVVIDLSSGLMTDALPTLVPPVSIAIWQGEDKL